MSSSENLNLKGIRFTYQHGDAEGSFETLKFYKEFLRGLLRQHWGHIVWLVGGLVEREAYLLYNANIDDVVKEMFDKSLEDKGKFSATYYESDVLLQKFREGTRVVKGRLAVEPPIEGQIPLYPGERELQLQSPVEHGGLTLHFTKAVYNPSSDYYKGGHILLFDIRVDTPTKEGAGLWPTHIMTVKLAEEKFNLEITNNI